MSDDWKVRVLPNGGRIEFIDAQWAPDEGDEPAGSIRVMVTFLTDGKIGRKSVLLTSGQIEEVLHD